MSKPDRLSAKDEDEVMRIRMRHAQALRAGMSNAEASAYANDPASVPGCGWGELTTEPAMVGGRGYVQSNLGGGSETRVVAPPLSPDFAAMPDRTGHDAKMDLDRL